MVRTHTYQVESLEIRRVLAAPAAPVIIEPLTNGEIVSRFDVHMEVDPTAYSDPDGNAHKATSWQIRETAASGGAVVWQALNVADPLSKVHIHLGDGAFIGTLAGQTALVASHSYVLHATFTDSNNEVSVTSQRTFGTAADTAPVPGEGTWIVHEGYKLELAAPAGSFRLPVDIAFVPNPGPNLTDPLYYVTELYGSIKMVNRAGSVSTYATGLLDYNPSGPISGTGEQGLTGIAVDPTSGDLFVAMLWNNGTSDATRGGATLHYPKVERLHSNDGGKTMATRTIIKNMQPETQGQSHQISNVSFGPDGKLYVHMGDGFTASTALSLTSYRGKVLRMNLDGTAPTDNPLYNGGTIDARDYIYTYGHRNPFGGAWRASNGKHWVVENGNSLDRMVDLTAGASYGWDGNDTTLSANSKFIWNPSEAPVNIAFVQSQTFGGSLFPAGSLNDAFVTLSGPTYAAGPQARGKNIVQFTDIDTLNASGKIATPPTTLLRYNGTGQATVSALATGPLGLYFSDLYRDDGVGGATASGANIYRLRYVDFHPNGLLATSGNAQVTLNWSNDPLATGTNIYRYISHGDTPTLVAANVAGTSFTDNTVMAGTQYHYIVRGVNSGGESSDSNEVHAAPTIPSIYAGGSGADRYRLKRSGANLNVWVGGDGTGAPTWSVVYAAAPSLNFQGSAGGDTLTIDNSAGNAIPAGGVSFDGGADADTIEFLGSAGADTITFAAGSLSIGGATIAHTNVESRTFNSSGGGDNLTITGGLVSRAAGTQTLRLSTLSITGTGKLDLADAGLVVDNTPFTTIRALVLQGFGTGSTTGITSSTSNGNQILGLFDNAYFGLAQWNGQPVAPGAVVGKYTYFGDVNFDGQVTGDDYTIIDSNFRTTPAPGMAWLSGDANLDGIVTGDDYTSIDSHLGLGVGNPLGPAVLRLREEDRAVEMLP